MKIPTRALLAAAALSASGACAAADDPSVGPPAKDWTLPLFTKEGFRQMTLRGDWVKPVSADQVDITGMQVTVFTGTADAKVDSVLLSPEATFMLNEKVARGDRAVRVIRDDVDVTGIGWMYLYNEKKVLIYHHAHVVFRAGLPDILK